MWAEPEPKTAVLLYPAHSLQEQEAQLMPTNPRDTFRGQSRSPNSSLGIGIVSGCAIVTIFTVLC